MPDLTIHDPRFIPDQRIALVGANIVDGSGKEGWVGDVLVHGNRIVKICPALSDEEKQGAKVIECKGRSLMPGLSALISTAQTRSWAEV